MKKTCLLKPQTAGNLTVKGTRLDSVTFPGIGTLRGKYALERQTFAIFFHTRVVKKLRRLGLPQPAL